MHEEWQDLIPFYIAGTLAAHERIALEQHLAQCEICRTATNEWSLISAAVRTAAESWAKPLPPLSGEVRADVLSSKEARNGYGGHDLPAAPSYQTIYQNPAIKPFPRRRSWIPATLVAVLISVLIFGGLLLIMVTRNNQAVPDYAGPGPEIAQLSQQPEQTSPEPRPTLTPGSTDLGILPVNPPTQTPEQISSKAQPTEEIAAALLSQPTQAAAPYTVPPTDRCTVTPAGSNPVLIYTWPNIEPIKGQINPGEYYTSWVYTNDGWYQVSTTNGLAGWVRSGEVSLYGPCDQMMLPSPTTTPITPQDVCLITNTAAERVVNIYAGPGRNYQIFGGITVYNTAEAIASSDNGWYRVRFSVPPQTMIIGWVAAEDAVNGIAGALCRNLPVLSSANYPAENPLPAGGTPVARFDRYIGMSQYDIVTTENVAGMIPANTRVRISQARFDGSQWWYLIVTQDGQQSVEASETQITFAPNVTPNAPTLTPTSLPLASPTASSTPCKPVFYFSDAHRAACTLPAQRNTIQAAYQPFERGFMVWRQDTGDVWVFSGSKALKYAEITYGQFPGNPVTDTAPQGKVKPISGFGRVWGNYENVRTLLGWATVAEQGYTMTVQFTTAPVITNYFYMTLPDGRVVKVFDSLDWTFETSASALGAN